MLLSQIKSVNSRKLALESPGEGHKAAAAGLSKGWMAGNPLAVPHNCFLDGEALEVAERQPGKNGLDQYFVLVFLCIGSVNVASTQTCFRTLR